MMEMRSVVKCCLAALLLAACLGLLAGCAIFSDNAAQEASTALDVPASFSPEPTETPVPSPTPAPTPTPEPTPEPTPQTASCSLRLVGDLMCCEYQMLGALLPDGGYDFNPSFGAVRAELESADLTIGNLETNFYPDKPYCGTKIGFNAPLEYLEAIRNCGFDLLVTANNHSLDMGIEGLLTTAEAIYEAGLDCVGTNLTPEQKDRVYVRDVNGLRLGVIACSTISNKIGTLNDNPDSEWAFNYYTEERLAAAAAAVREAGAEAILLYVHAGTEKDKSPRRSQYALAEYAYTLGVDIVIMSHTHSLLPMEKKQIVYEGREKTVFCAYGLGNFMSSALHDESLRNVILNLDLRLDRATGALDIQASYIPTFTINFYDENRARQFYIIPIEAALADFENVVDSRTRTGAAALEREWRVITDRLGTEAATPVVSFLS
ncbi:MAG: CapA family protein [Clostridia bacterium]|nr:CapA family protein [Clostridia bacterium]